MSEIVDIIRKNFAVMTQAPNGVEELRKMVLQLAVQGKLTEKERPALMKQPDYEPADKLLERINTEKDRLVAEGKIKKPKELPAIKPEEVPFELPKAWLYLELGKCIVLTSGQHLLAKDYNTDGHGIPYLTGPADFGEKQPIVTKWTQTPKVISSKGEILITVKGAGLGKLNVVHLEKVAISRQLMALDTLFGYNHYLYIFLKSSFNYFQNQGVGIAIPGLSRNLINNLPIPVPPLLEQEAIVAKVDTLMSLIERLGTKQTQAKEAKTKLNDASLQALLQPATPTQFAVNWNRIHKNFDLLYDNADNLDKLRQAVLQLAVQGKLTEKERPALMKQPDYEPADKLLARIKAEKDRLVAEGKIKKPKELPAIKPEEVPFVLPEGWAYIQLRSLGEFCGGGTPSKAKSAYWGGEILWVSPKDMKFPDISQSELTITKDAVANSAARLIPQQSILIVARSGILKRTLPVAINKVECTVNQDMKVIIPFQTDLSEYIRLLLIGFESVILKELVKGGMTVQSLKYTEFEEYVFILPPQIEQKAIVAKVDSLMALIDQLEGKQTQATISSESLVQSIVHKISN